MAESIEELSIRIGLEVDEGQLKAEMDKSAKVMENSLVEPYNTIDKKIKKIPKTITDTLKKSKSKIKKTTDSTIGKSVESSVRKGLNQAFSVAGGVLIAKTISKIGLAAKEAFGSAVDRAINFEKGIAEVNSILDKNVVVTERASDAILRFSANFGTEQQKQVRSFYNIVSAGVKGASNQLKVLEISNKAAVAGLVNIDTAAFAIVSSVNAYAAAGLSAARASDILFKGVKEGQLVFRELATSIGRVAPIASKAGLSFSEVIGSLAGVTRTGVTAQEAASALRQLFTTILKPSEQAKKVISDVNQEIEQNIAKQIELGNVTKQQGLAQLNKTLINFSKEGIKAAGIAPFLSNLTKQIKGNSTALNTLFKNVRAFTAVASATANIGQFQKILESVKDSVGATDAAFAILSDTIDFKLKKSASILKAFGTIVLSAFTKPFKDALDSSLEAIPAILLTISDLAIKVLPIFELMTRGLIGSVKFFFNSFKLIADFAKFGVLKFAKTFQEELLFAFGDLPIIGDQIKGFFKTIDTDLASTGESIDANLDGIRKSFDDTLNFSVSESATKLQENLERILLGQDAFTESMKTKLADLFKSVKKNGEKINKELNKQNKALQGALVAGISRTTQALVGALKDGKDVVDVLTKGVLGTAGDMAIQVGEVVIATAIAKTSLLGSPAAGLAAGAGLIAIGALLKSFAGGEGGLQGGGGGAAGGGVAAGGTLVPEEAEPESLTPSTVVNLNVEGSVFDGDNTARRLADLLNAGFDNENITLKQGF